MTTDLTITCSRCKAVLDHRCNTDLRNIFIRLLRFETDDVPISGFKKSDYYSNGDENSPFFSEAYLYSLIGKEDARTVLAMLHRLMVACGFDRTDLEKAAFPKEET
jgi:hypothetical protein